MKKIAVSSHKGGVGKTTVALLLAKYATGLGKKTFVVDFDLLGAGLADLIRFERKADKYLEDFLLTSDPEGLRIKDLISVYTDRDIQSRSIKFILNMIIGMPLKEEEEEFKDNQRDIWDMIADDSHHGQIRAKMEHLFSKLEKEGTDLVVFDCHPGLGFISEIIRPKVDVNLYITTQNRSDCFGLLKEVNLKQLDDKKSILILNRFGGSKAVSLMEALSDYILLEGVLKTEFKSLLGQLLFIGKDEKHFAVIPESDELSNYGDIGSPGILPKIDPKSEDGVYMCYSKIFSLLDNQGE